MAFDLAAFSFDDTRLSIDPARDLIARVPFGLTDRKALFDVLARDLGFPDYFGRNWNALNDCLRDFSWTERRRAIIVHDDLPALGLEQIGTYLDVLADCVCDWKPGEDHELIVVFPPHCRDRIAELAAGLT